MVSPFTKKYTLFQQCCGSVRFYSWRTKDDTHLQPNSANPNWGSNNTDFCIYWFIKNTDQPYMLIHIDYKLPALPTMFAAGRCRRRRGGGTATRRDFHLDVHQLLLLAAAVVVLLLMMLMMMVVMELFILLDNSAATTTSCGWLPITVPTAGVGSRLRVC